MTDVQLPEAKAFYGFQMAMENIHSEMYSLLIDQYITDPSRKQALFKGLTTFPCIHTFNILYYIYAFWLHIIT